MAVGKNGLVTALDVGSTKVCCFIARPDGSGGMRVIGIGHQIAKGMRAGTVVDIDAAEEAVRCRVVRRLARRTWREGTRWCRRSRGGGGRVLVVSSWSTLLISPPCRPQSSTCIPPPYAAASRNPDSPR